MSPVHEEPSAKRRRLAGRENAAQQHSSSHSDSNDSVLECPQRQAPFSSHASPSTPSPNTISSSQFQQGTREPSQMHLVGTEPTPHGPFSIIQPWERASNTWYHSAWGQMPYFASTHVPNHGHVWHNPAAILPIPPHFHSQGVSPCLLRIIVLYQPKLQPFYILPLPSFTRNLPRLDAYPALSCLLA